MRTFIATVFVWLGVKILPGAYQIQLQPAGAVMIPEDEHKALLEAAASEVVRLRGLVRDLCRTYAPGLSTEHLINGAK